MRGSAWATTFSSGAMPSAESGVHVNDKLVKFHDLKPGEKISFYVSEDRLTASELPGDTNDSWSVLPPQ